MDCAQQRPIPDAGGYEHHAGKSAGLGSGRDPSSGGAESMVHHCEAIRKRAYEGVLKDILPTPEKVNVTLIFITPGWKCRIP